jgi:serine/threonine protein phosphatase PrpC
MSEGTPMARDCPACGERVFVGDGYCEACGRSLREDIGCHGCGAAAIGEDGYCESCGLLQPTGRDRVEAVLPVGAAVSDRGLRHSRNEDAVALAAAGRAVVAVVSDGVSTAPRPDEASMLAVRTAAGVLAEQLDSGADAETATATAMATAAKAVAGLATGAYDAPACTYVSAVVEAERVTVGWIGDSRVYWLAGTRAARPTALLTRDDTLLNQMRALGPASTEQARAADLLDRRSHVLTAWLGADADPIRPHIETFTPDGPGAVVVCSDGLWNHLPEPAQLATATPAAIPPIEAARALVRVALDGGGQDNITVALVPFPPEVNPLST